jgi:hypothetical protein
MRFFYSSITVFVIANCCTFGGRRSHVEVEPAPVIISDLVGDEIDLDERDRYGLFNNINDFVSASFYERPKQEKGCKIVLITRDKRYVSWNNDPLTPTMLRDYIEHYDSISLSLAGYEEKWQIVDYDTLGLPITQAEISAVSSIKGACLGTSAGLGMLAGCIIGLQLSAEDRDTYYGGDWDVGGMQDQFRAALIGASIGTVAGTLAGVIMTKVIEDQKRPESLRKIKEMRKPKMK